jgi:hypothetical protein
MHERSVAQEIEDRAVTVGSIATGGDQEPAVHVNSFPWLSTATHSSTVGQETAVRLGVAAVLVSARMFVGAECHTISSMAGCCGETDRNAVVCAVVRGVVSMYCGCDHPEPAQATTLP